VKLQHHIVVSAVLSAAVCAASRSWPLTVSSFVTGALLDADHLLDFWREYGWREDLRRIFRVCHGRQLRRAVLLLHGWEWVVAAAGLAWAAGGSPWAVGAAFGLGQHLILDQFSNRPAPLGYFLLWRARRGFGMDAVFPEQPSEETP
jgi:hypothetical protein